MELEITPEPSPDERAAIEAALSELLSESEQTPGAWSTDVAWWALLVALVFTLVSGLDYARAAPRLLRGPATG